MTASDEAKLSDPIPENSIAWIRWNLMRLNSSVLEKTKSLYTMGD
jgi:hypothetical protein